MCSVSGNELTSQGFTAAGAAVPWVIRCDGDSALLPFSPLAQRWMVSYQQDMLAL